MSVLFVDLVGFTTFSEGRDAEEVRSALSDYFARAQEIVELHGGVVEKFIGDAVMAVWGTPVARENDTERSVRAAIEVIAAVVDLGRTLGVNLQARAGIYTGEAAVNLAAKGQGMVAGDMVNTASRLQSVADPGTILVDRATYLGARGAISFESAGELTLKGKQAPVEAWRAVRVSAATGGFKQDDALEPAFAGRDEEFRLLKDLLHATGREQKPRLASVLGVGGIGKSRLVWELFKYIDGLSETIYWHQGRSPAYGEGIVFWALGEMVRMRARIAETDDEDAAAEKLEACLAEYIADEEERRWLHPQLAHLLGLGEATEGAEQLFAAWRTFFERIAERGTVVLVFEDLHWADQGVIDFIEHVMSWARTSSILILTLARPELLERRPNWGAGQRNFVSVHLEPLHDDDMTLLLKSIASELPAEMRDAIVERAEGIPLYAVEMVRMLVDREDLVPDGDRYRWVGGHDSIEVPDSLHALIASRLDTLPVSDRLLVQDAAVLGKTFTLKALCAVASISPEELEPRLNDLVQREIFLVDTDPRSPERGQYGFVQSLIREVAYQTLSNENRKARHITAARYFASLNEADLIDAVATHYMEAHANARSGDEANDLAQLARAALLEAANRAESLGSNVQSFTLLERALSVTDDPAERAELLFRAGSAASAAGRFEHALEHLTACLELTNEIGERDLRSRARVRLCATYYFLSQLDEAERVVTEGIEELGDDEDSPEAAALFAEAGRIQIFKGNNELGERYTAMALPPAERAQRVDTIADALITRGVVAIFAGRPHEADALLAGALKLAKEHGLVPQQVRAGINIAANQSRVDPALALETAKTTVEMARKYGLRDAESVSVSTALESAIFLCEWDWIRSTIAEAEEHQVGDSALMDSTVAIVDAYLGDLDSARRRLERFRRFGDMTSTQDRSIAAAAEATIAFVAGDLDGALEAALREAEAGSHDQLWPFGLVGRAATWKGDLGAARVERARLEASTIQNAWLTTTILTLDAAIAAIRGDRSEAIDMYTSALAAWERLQIPLCQLLCKMDMALLVGGEEAAAAAADAERYFSELGNTYFMRRLQAARS